MADVSSSEGIVGGRLRVDADSLQRDGRDLAAVSDAPAADDCPAPAFDPVSISLAFALSAHDQSLCDELGYARLVREHGGAVVTAAGVMFEVADDNAALRIDRVEVDHETRPASVAAASMPLLPPRPAMPPIPNIPVVHPQLMEPEEFAKEIHTGRGSGCVRDFSAHWRYASDHVTETGDRASRVGDAIDEHWPDNFSNAASNVREHGRWMHEAAEWAQRLSKGAESAAVAFDYARKDTPSPSDFAHARAALEASMRLGTKRTVSAAQRNLDGLEDQARRAGAEYEKQARLAVRSVGHPISLPPLIAERAVIPHGLVKGPGEWSTKTRRDGEWRNYEQQVTGYPAGMEYDVPSDDGSRVAFDGFDPSAGPNGLLIEAKGRGYEWMIGPDGKFKPSLQAGNQISDELRRQYGASQLAGSPVEWRVAEPKTAIAIENIIDGLGYEDQIHVVVVPAA